MTVNNDYEYEVFEREIELIKDEIKRNVDSDSTIDFIADEFMRIQNNGFRRELFRHFIEYIYSVLESQETK